jgi:hypothetical protein
MIQHLGCVIHELPLDLHEVRELKRGEEAQHTLTKLGDADEFLSCRTGEGSTGRGRFG